MSSSPVPASDGAYADEPAWWRTVAWPQVLTLLGIGLAVLVPLLVVIAVAAG